MIKLEEFEAFYKYLGSFADFALDFFGIETTQDVESRQITLEGPEDLVVAHIVWKLVFNQGQTFMIATPSDRIAQYWHHRVIDAIAQLPEYMNCGMKIKRNEISTGTGCLALFRICSTNVGRGMTLSGLYVIEPHLIRENTYRDFMHSILPTMLSGTQNRQIVHHSRGY